MTVDQISIQAAEEALLTITPADIAVVRKLGRPPRLIRQIMDCVLILFGRPLKTIKIDPELQGPEPSWESSLRVKHQLFTNTSLTCFLLLAHVRYGFSSKSSSIST